MNKKNGTKKAVMKHLREDIKESQESIREDKKLQRKLKSSRAKPKAA